MSACANCVWESRPGTDLLAQVSACEDHRDDTEQERRLRMAVHDVFSREAKRQGTFVCRGFGGAYMDDVTALVRKALDDVCHGGSLREAVPDSEEIDSDVCRTCLLSEDRMNSITVYDPNRDMTYQTSCPTCLERVRQATGFYERLAARA